MHSFMWECIKTNFVRHALNRPQIGGKKGEIPLVIDTFQYNGTFWRRQKLSENKKKDTQFGWFYLMKVTHLNTDLTAVVRRLIVSRVNCVNFWGRSALIDIFRQFWLVHKTVAGSVVENMGS